MFSSLSESGFIPTIIKEINISLRRLGCSHLFQRVASFLHTTKERAFQEIDRYCSHLFQRVASFLLSWSSGYPVYWFRWVLISFREWLHSYLEFREMFTNNTSYWFSSLSESGFIPTKVISRRFIGFRLKVLISFREWLHSYRNIQVSRNVQ